VGDDAHEVERTGEGVRIDGRDLPVELVHKPGASGVHLRINDRGYSLLSERVEAGWRLQLGGRHFDLSIEDERARAIRELTGDADATASSRDLRAPMPGLVVKILAEPGQRVDAGVGLVVVEAMKMENELKSEGPGVIATIRVEPGQAVNRDDVLVTFESESG
jgi:pyruvate carboxylase subunit B